MDARWKRGMSYLKLGWNWIQLAITQQSAIQVYRFLSSALNPQSALPPNVNSMIL
ncbi:hypothetical protein IFO70_37805 [Phormidium tenue FACHB-886]|nr:hypothetical protein [Phormidium tenue FACHB-886]